MLFSILWRKKIETDLMYFTSNGWSLNIARKSVQNKLIKHSKRTNKIVYITLLVFLTATFCYQPIFCSMDSLVPFKMIYKFYFEMFGVILYYFYSISLVYLIGYSSIRHCYLLWYITAHIEIQISLIREKLLTTDKNYIGVEENLLRNSINYQNNINKKLRSCIRHHIFIKRFSYT